MTHHNKNKRRGTANAVRAHALLSTEARPQTHRERRDAFKPTIFGAKRVATVYGPARHCQNAGCGDKIKDDETWEVTFTSGDVRHYHEHCCDERGTPLPMGDP